MNIYKVFSCSNLILRGFRTLQQTSSLFYEPKVSQLQFRQFSFVSNIHSLIALNNLKTFTPLVMSTCGMKSKGRLQLRCKNCYFERKDGEMYVNCTSFGRHKQVLRKKRRQKFNWILSYAFMSKIRPY